MTEIASSVSGPRALILTWVAVLVAPLAWFSAVVLMFALIGDNCAAGSRILLWVNVAACILLAVAPAVLGSWSRSLDSESAAAIRTRLILYLVVAGSVVLALVMLATAVPILLQNACGA